MSLVGTGLTVSCFTMNAPVTLSLALTLMKPVFALGVITFTATVAPAAAPPPCRAKVTGRAAGTVIAAVMILIGVHFLSDYQKARVESFLDPERDPQGKGYQLIQSQIAVGSGGMFGKVTPWTDPEKFLAAIRA